MFHNADTLQCFEGVDDGTRHYFVLPFGIDVLVIAEYTSDDTVPVVAVGDGSW